MLYPEIINKTIICPTCEGNGWVKVGNERENHNHDKEQCRDCNGHGIVRKISSIQYQKLHGPVQSVTL
jgi:DnaJ-class molecular chaperone